MKRLAKVTKMVQPVLLLIRERLRGHQLKPSRQLGTLIAKLRLFDIEWRSELATYRLLLKEKVDRLSGAEGEHQARLVWRCNRKRRRDAEDLWDSEYERLDLQKVAGGRVPSTERNRNLFRKIPG